MHVLDLFLRRQHIFFGAPGDQRRPRLDMVSSIDNAPICAKIAIGHPDLSYRPSDDQPSFRRCLGCLKSGKR